MNSQTNTNTQTQIWFEMSQGEGTKMYTLWRCVSRSDETFSRVFQQNLSIDKETALAKATELAKGYELIDDSFDDLRPIIRGDEQIKFGKHYGTYIKDLPDGYLKWVAQGATVPADEKTREQYGDSCTVSLVNEKQMGLAQLEATKRGFYVEFEGKLQPKGLVDWIIKKRESDAASQFIGTIGEKVEVEVIFESVKHFETQWGTSSLNIFRTYNGSVIKYFGNDLRGCLRHEELYNLETGETISYSRGDGNNDKIVKQMTLIADMRGATEEQKVEIIAKMKEYDELNLDYYLMILPKTKDEKIQYFGYKKLEESVYDFKLGDTYLLKATIKGHDEYLGCKQTQVLRPKLSKI